MDLEHAGISQSRKIERSCVFCSKNRAGKWKMPQTLANSAKAGWEKRSVPPDRGSQQWFLPHRLFCRAMPCLADTGRSCSLALLRVEVVKVSHWARLESSSWSPYAPGSPLITFFQVLKLLFRSLQRHPAFPLTKQVGLSGVSSVKSIALCFHGDACFSINRSPFIVASFLWWEKLEIELVPPDHFYTIQVRLRAKSRQNNRQKTIFSLQRDPSCST